MDKNDNPLYPSQQKQTYSFNTKRFQTLMNSFCNTIQNNWIRDDKEIYAVLSYISNLRHRIYIESKTLVKLHNKANDSSSSSWSRFRYRSNSNSNSLFLNENDLQMTLDHDLKQHEKMMTGLRILIASLSETYNSLGRKLEDVILYSIDFPLEEIKQIQLSRIDNNNRNDKNRNTNNDYNKSESVTIIVNRLDATYTKLATELYRKQCLLSNIMMNANMENLLFHDTTTKENKNDRPRQIAKYALKEWNKSSFLDDFLKDHRRN